MTQIVHNSIIVYTKAIFLLRLALPTDITRLEGRHNDGEQYGRLKIIVHVDLTESNDSVRLACTFYIDTYFDNIHDSLKECERGGLG